MLKYIAFSIGLLIAWLPCNADDFSFRVRSLHKFTAQVDFVSQDRNAAWPGNDRAYPLDDDNVHTLTLRCRANEKICFGAWDKAQAKPEWGVGNGHQLQCKNCCWFCEHNKQTPIITLHTRRTSSGVVPFFTIDTPAPPKPPKPAVILDDSQ